MEYLAEELVEKVKQLEDFKLIPAGYWIIGIRNSDDAPDKFDDSFYLMKGEELILDTTGTTNAGQKVLKGGFKRYNKDGAAVLEADRIYYSVWKYGLHRGKMPALRQLGAAVTIWRDGDMDGKAEEIGKRTTGYYGINFHADQYDLSKDKRSDNAIIGGWSAGCQVCNKIEDYTKIIEHCKTQKSTTYCLLNEFSI